MPAFLAAFCLIAASDLGAQTSLITCILTAEAPLLRAESRAERVGDLRIACTGGDPNLVHFVNLALFLDTPITSDLTDTGIDETEALLLIDEPRPGVPNVNNGVTYLGQVKGRPGVSPGPPGGPGADGSGNIYAGVRTPGVQNQISWNGVPVVPAPPGSSRVLRLVNVRGDMTRLATQPGVPLSVTARLSVSPSTSLPIINPQLVVGSVLRSLSAMPATEPAGNILRFEEAFTTAFKKRIENTTSSPTSSARQGVPETFYFTESGFTPDYEGLDATEPGVADTGTRFVARFANLPVGAYLIAPNSVASMIPGAGPGPLQVRRVSEFDASLAGGVLASSSAGTDLVPVDGGQATVVYEVLAQAPYEGVNGATSTERFDIPVEVVFPQPVSIGSASVSLGYAPADATPTFSAPAPEPRFNTFESGTVAYPIRVGPTLGYVTFTYIPGDRVPLTQDYSLDPAKPAFSASLRVLPQTGGNWLSVTANSTPTTRSIQLSANPVGLPAGTYFSGVGMRLESQPSNLVIVPAILEVLPAPELLVETAPVMFRMNAGDPPPAPRIVYVTAKTRAVNFTAGVSTTSGGEWLSVSPTSSGTPSNMSVAVQPGQLPPGTYEGAIRIASPNASNSPQTINVSLIIAERGPVFSSNAVVNAASYIGGAVAPGEIITFFGMGIGPQAPTGPVFDVEGRLATFVAGTRIVIGGVEAPIISVSRTQSSAIVPFKTAGLQSVDVQIEFEGTRSQPVSIPVTQSAPGIFTVNAQGTGQGAIINQNSTRNSPENPADRGSAVAIYLTGAGLTEPPSIDGAPADPSNLPRITQRVTVRVGGVDAPVEYAGGAPGAVAGLYQVNARIAPSVAPGSAVPIEVSIGSASSQPGVTIAIR
jgi:uncharacterized protein (TIGR03437 family)